MTKDQPAKIEGKHATRLNVMVGISGVMSVGVLIYCINGGDKWVTLGLALIGVALAVTGVTWAAKGAAADAARTAEQTDSPTENSATPKPPESAVI